MSHDAANAAPPADGTASPDPLETPAQKLAKLEAHAAVATPAIAARLLLHAAHLAAEALGDQPLARRLLDAALAREATYRPALEGLIQHAAAEGDWRSVSQLYERVLALTTDAAQQFELLRAMATCAARVGDASAAEAARDRACALLPESPTALAWRAERLRASGAVAEEIALRQRIAAITRDERLKARQHLLASEAAASAGDTAKARELLGELFTHAPNDFIAQAVVLGSKPSPDMIEKALRAELDGSGSIDAHVELARFLSSRRGQHADALELLQPALDKASGDARLHAAFVEIATRAGETALAAKHLEALAHATSAPPSDRAHALLTLARSSSGDTATSHYRRVLALFPEHPEARFATQAAPAPPTPEALLAAEESALANESDVPAKARRLVRIGLQLERVGRVDDAIARYAEAGLKAPGAAAAWCDLLEHTGRWAPLVDLLQEVALVVADTTVRFDALVTRAEVLEFKLNDHSGALAAYREALAVQHDAAVLAGLVRCAEVSGDAAGTARALEWLGTVSSAQARRSRLRRAARLQLESCASPADALRLWRTILEQDPDDAAARYAVEQLGPPPGSNDAAGANEAAAARALGEGRWEDAVALLEARVNDAPDHPTAWIDLTEARVRGNDLEGAIQTLERRAAGVEAPGAKGALLLEAARRAERNGLDRELVERLAAAASAADPHSAPAARLVARLAVDRGDASTAVSALEREVETTEGREHAAARRRLGTVVARLAGDAARGLSILRAAFDEDPTDLWTVAELERLYAACHEPVKSAEFRSKLAARCSDIRFAAWLRATAAEDRALGGDADAAVNEYRRALAVDGRLRLAMDEVLVALRRRGDRTALVDLYQRMAPFFDNDTQGVLALWRGELLEVDGQAENALRHYRDAIAADPLLLPALDAARRLHEANGEWDEVRSLLAQEGETHVDPDEGVRLTVAAGEMAEERLRSPETAESHYLRALERRPGEPRAMARLDAMLRLQGRFAELVAIYEREGEAAGDRPPRSAELYAEAAWLRVEKLGEEKRAAVPLNRALARDPSCGRALELKSRLALSSGNAGEAESAILSAIERDPAQAPRLHARLAEARLAAGNSSGALESARLAVAAEATSDTLELLFKTATSAGEHAAATDALEQLLSITPDRIAAARHARAGAAAKAGIPDFGAAAALYRRALEFLPGDPEAIAGLEPLHERHADLPGLAATFDGLASAPGLDPGTMRQYATRAAAAWTRAGTPTNAVASLETALKAAPNDLGLRTALARALGAAAPTRVRAMAEYRAILQQSPLSPDALRELAAVFDAEGRTDAVLMATACLVGLDAATESELARYDAAAPRLVPPATPLEPADLERVVHAAERGSPIREFFWTLGPALTKVVVGNLERHGLSRSDKARPEHRALADQLAQFVGAGDFELLTTARAPAEIWIENTEPASLVVGASIVERPRAELAFALGTLLGRVRMRNQAAFFAQPIEIANLVAEALRQADPNFSRFGARSEALTQAVARGVGRAEKRAVEALLPRFQGPVNFAAFTMAAAHSAHRFGLVACSDPAAALRLLTRPQARTFPPALERPDVRELVGFAVGEEYLAVRQNLRVALA